MDIGFFFEFENKVIQLPVNPEKVSVKYDGNNKTEEIVKLGEINLLKDRKLADISFESFLPQNTWFPSIRTIGLFETPSFYKDFFIGIQESCKPLRLIITGLNINMMVSIEKFDYFHQAGDHEDAYFSIELKEYRQYYIRKEVVGNEGVGKPTKLLPSRITIGSSVILNGTVHYDSYGTRPGRTFSNYKCKVNLINKAGTHPYHVTTLEGEWLGWVTAKSVVLS